MHKIRSYQLLIIAVALVILSAFLPRSATNLIDSINTQKVTYADLHIANSELSKVETNATMSVVEKLSILSHSNSIEVESDASLNLSPNEAVSLAKSNFVQYESCGLFNEIPHVVSYVQPSLEIDNYDRERYCIVWKIELIGPDSTELDIILDDETGLILTIEYYTDGHSGDPIMNTIENLRKFSEIYFESVGITNPTRKNSGYYNEEVYSLSDDSSAFVTIISFEAYPSSESCPSNGTYRSNCGIYLYN